MRRNNNEKNWMEPAEPVVVVPFLDPESAENATSVAVELRERLLKVEEQVLGQYSSAAAYATLAQQGTDQARAEARADHERLQATIIGLLDRLRVEMNTRLDSLESRPTQVGSPLADRTDGWLASSGSASELALH